MKQIKSHKRQALALLCIGLLACGSVLAEKPSWSGGGHEDKPGNDGKRSGSSSNNGGGHDNTNYEDRNHDGDRNHNDRDRDDNKHYSDRNHDGDRDHGDRDRTYSSRYFDDHSRNNIHDYYSQRRYSGHCPPGLAKKHNGCVPPGHARQWVINQRLPRDVIFYNVEPQVLAYLSPPPPRHRYVRVASDILLIAMGTGMVLDAIDDLGRY